MNHAGHGSDDTEKRYEDEQTGKDTDIGVSFFDLPLVTSFRRFVMYVHDHLSICDFVPDRGTERIGILRGIQIHHDGGVSITGDPFRREERIRHHGGGEIEKAVIGMGGEDLGLVFRVIHMIRNIAQSEDRSRNVQRLISDMQGVSNGNAGIFRIERIQPETGLILSIRFPIHDMNAADVVAGDEIQFGLMTVKIFNVGKDRVFAFRVQYMFHATDLLQIIAIQFAIGIQILQVALLIKPIGRGAHAQHIGFDAGIGHDTDKDHEKDGNKLGYASTDIPQHFFVKHHYQLTSDMAFGAGFSSLDWTFPFFNRITRSAISAIRVLWVTTMTVVPFFVWSRSSCSTPTPVLESSAPVGSSQSSTSGFFMMARAMETRCCSPPDSSDGNLVACSCRPTPARTSITS